MAATHTGAMKWMHAVARLGLPAHGHLRRQASCGVRSRRRALHTRAPVACSEAPVPSDRSAPGCGDGKVTDTVTTAASGREGQPFLITTPIYYVNAAPHIGHLFSSLLADARARWARMQGMRVRFTTGTDEHGLKVQHAAEAAGVTPGEFCDRTSQRFRDLFDDFGIAYDDFVRTTESRHLAMASDVWSRLRASGHVYMGHHEGWYCETDEAFLTSQQVQPAPGHEEAAAAGEATPMVSCDSGRPVVRVKEENYMFKLRDSAEALEEWLVANPAAVTPPARYNEVLAGVRRGLHDLSVSRLHDNVQWGIPVPDDPDHTMYVWLDALTNYLTVTGASLPQLLDAACEGDAGATGTSPDTGASCDPGLWPAAVHVVGKDILKFHAMYWPAFLKGLGLAMPTNVTAHGHWVVDNVKMSKSLGNVVDPYEILERHGVDESRYYLLREGSLKYDAQFSHERVQLRRKADLVSTFGNLAARCTSPQLLPSRRLVRPRDEDLTSADREFLACIDQAAASVGQLYDELNFHNALERLMALLYEANRYFDANEPWKLKPKPSDSTDGAADTEADAEAAAASTRLATVLWCSVESVRVAGLLLAPVMPSSSARLLDHLGVDEGERTAACTATGVGAAQRVVSDGEARKFVLFPRE